MVWSFTLRQRLRAAAHTHTHTRAQCNHFRANSEHLRPCPRPERWPDSGLASCRVNIATSCAADQLKSGHTHRSHCAPPPGPHPAASVQFEERAPARTCSLASLRVSSPQPLCPSAAQLVRCVPRRHDPSAVIHVRGCWSARAKLLDSRARTHAMPSRVFLLPGEMQGGVVRSGWRDRSCENSEELRSSGLADDHGGANPVDLLATLLSTRV